MIRILIEPESQIMVNDGERVHERTMRQLRLLLKHHDFEFTRDDWDVHLPGNVVWEHEALGTLLQDFITEPKWATYGPEGTVLAMTMGGRAPAAEVPHGILNTWSCQATLENIAELRQKALDDENPVMPDEVKKDVLDKYFGEKARVV